ncbi:MAG TPA: ABC transporter substrate-binding protein [Candidatus Saccharimonadales bacterium]|nr:ABC transporter substrate-binding protein [Candidatus Saccharimonadales bacterium]
MKLIFVALLAIYFLHTPVQAADKIRISTPGDAAHFTMHLAQRRGFLKEEGFDAELIVISGPVANVALSNGDTDYFSGFGSALRSILQGLPLRFVACYRPTPHFMLQTRPEYKSVRDLKGKTIGITAYGSGTELVGRLMIKHFGLDPDKDVKFIPGGSSEGRLIRMQQGLLDATVATVPTDYHGRKMGYPILVRSEDLFTYPFSGLTAHIKKIKEKPDEVKRVIRAGIKANRYMRANRDGTIPVLMNTYRIDKEVASAAYDSFIKGFNNDGSMPEDGFRRLLDDTKRVMKLDREVALSDVADLSILREAQRELGIK